MPTAYHIECQQWHEVNRCPREVAILREKRLRMEASKESKAAKVQETISEQKHDNRVSVGVINHYDSIDSPSPNLLYSAIERSYNPLPELPSFRELVVTALATFLYGGGMLIFATLITGYDLSPAWLLILIVLVLRVYSHYTVAKTVREKEENRRNAIKSKYKLLQRWFEEEEQRYRFTSGYPEDWNRQRKEYVKLRDERVCRLCFGVRDNDSYYYHHPGDKRHAYRNSKDFSLSSQVHHIIPISKGGNHNPTNLIYLCNLCHEDQHEHLLKRRATVLERKSRQSRAIGGKEFWSTRHEDVLARLASLAEHRRRTGKGWKLHVYAQQGEHAL